MNLHQQLTAAMAHHQAGRIAQAERLYREALATSPDSADVLHLLGVLCAQKGAHSEAIDLIRKAIALQPNTPGFHINLARAQKSAKDSAGAVESYRRALELHPSTPEAFEAQYYLAVTLMDLANIDEALPAARRAVAINPSSGAAHNTLGAILKEDGQLEAALAERDKALELEPNHPVFLSNSAYTLEFDPRSTPQSLLANQRLVNQRFKESLKIEFRPHENDRNPNRRLRIAYVSPYFRKHAETFFVLPLLESHDRQNFEIHCYSDGTEPDEITDRLRKAAHAWHETASLTHNHLAEKIRADRIDILIDLAMFMSHNRAPAIAQKPAPIQIAWLAYPGGSGLDAIDYRITDPYLDPLSPNAHGAAVGSSITQDENYHELSIHLPTTWVCYNPLTDEPPATPRPAGPIRFGSVNNPCKLNDALLDLWSKVLHAVPDSQIFLQANSASHRARIRAFFESRGIPGDCVKFAVRCPRPKYLRAYDRIDICLDPLPYNGITTSCDALWMGVPVVTLLGQTAAGRAGASILQNLDLPDLIAKTPDEFVKIAANLAADSPRLADLRQSLRGRMESSPLMNAKKFARDIEAAYRNVWSIWCNERPADPDQLHALTVKYVNENRYADALTPLDQLLELRPQWPQGWANRAWLLRHLARAQDGLAPAHRALDLDPNCPDAHHILALCLYDLGRIDEALPSAQTAVKLNPRDASYRNTLGLILKEDGQIEPAIDQLHAAVEIEPQNPIIHGGLVYLLEFDPRSTARSLLAHQRQWNQRHAVLLKRFIRPHANDRDPDRRLRIAYVSPYFWEHAESFYVVPLLESHDPAQVEIHCYSDSNRPDAATQRLKSAAHAWHDIVGFTHQQLAEKIRADRIDIAIDLSMHMASSRALTFALKPAPVQIAWLAYPGGIGLDAIDYRITDPFLDPPELGDSDYHEKSIRLPSTWVCYDPMSDQPPAIRRPPGPICFGSLNNPCKLTDSLLQLWAAVLRAVPDSQILIQAISSAHRDRIRSTFQSQGVPPARVHFAPRFPRREYLRAYDSIDICLDPFPANGGTTSYDALWMGVPLITLPGQTAIGRAGVSILQNVGLPDLIAKSPDDFVKSAANLAADTARLTNLRSTLRAKFQSSPLMNFPKFAADMEAAYRQTWKTHCASG